MATNVGPQQVQSDAYTSSLCDEPEVLNITSATSKGIITVINERKNMKKRDVNIKGGDVTVRHRPPAHNWRANQRGL